MSLHIVRFGPKRYTRKPLELLVDVRKKDCHSISFYFIFPYKNARSTMFYAICQQMGSEELNSLHFLVTMRRVRVCSVM